MDFIVATIDLDSTFNPSYDTLDEVLAQYSLYTAHPKAFGPLPRNTYFGRLPAGVTVDQHAHAVFAAVRDADLHPTRLMLAQTARDNVVTVTD